MRNKEFLVSLVLSRNGVQSQETLKKFGKWGRCLNFPALISSGKKNTHTPKIFSRGINDLNLVKNSMYQMSHNITIYFSKLEHTIQATGTCLSVWKIESE